MRCAFHGSLSGKVLMEVPILVVGSDDNLYLCALLRNWLESVFSECRVTVASITGKVVDLAQAQSPWLILMDTSLSGTDDIEFIRRIKAAVPAAEIVVLGMREDKAYCDDVTFAGATAYVHKWRIGTELEPTLKGLFPMENERSTLYGT